MVLKALKTLKFVQFSSQVNVNQISEIIFNIKIISL